MTNIKVFGSGCASCKRLHERAVLAAKTLGIEGEVEYLTDIQRLIDLGVMQSPVMTINDEPAIVGYVPSEEEIVKTIKEALGR